LGESAMKVLAALVISIGFLPPGSFDTAMAPDRSWIKMRDRGTLEVVANRTVTGGGDFIKSDGESGTWTATAVDGFVSYGASTFRGRNTGPTPMTNGPYTSS
jgi:hypothetical protein